MIEILTNFEAADRLPHPRYDRAFLALVTAKREMGKTTLLQRYIQQREPRLFMLDPHNDFPNVPQYESAEDAIRYLMSVSGESVAAWARVVPPWSSVDDDAGDDSFTYGEHVFALVNEYLRNCLCIYNEATLWMPQILPRLHPLKKQITQGRRIGIKHIIDTQRFQLLPDIMRSEGTHLVAGRTTRYRDRQVISQETTPEVGEIVGTLEKGQFVLVEL